MPGTDRFPRRIPRRPRPTGRGWAVVLGVLALVAVVGVTVVVVRTADSRHASPQAPVAEQPLAGRPVGGCGVGESARTAALGEALDHIEAGLATGVAGAQWGDLDLRDLYSYHVDRLWRQGIDGCGTAVAVLEGWDDPHIQARLDALDTTIGLPHATVETVYPDGRLPARCPAGMEALGSYGSCAAWRGELELDVEAVHLIAPYATIVVSATPSDSEVVGDPSSEVAMPELVRAMEYVSQHRLANVISVSDGSSETDYRRGAAEIRAQDVGELTAAAAGVPVVDATGDCGAAQNLTTATRQCGTVSAGPASATWGDSPWVTAVGGSRPHHTAPCPPCTRLVTGEDTFSVDPIEGAGVSEIYPRPAYQARTSRLTGSPMRSVPDLTMDSADGTSQAAPLFAGVLALATQVRGADLGPINPALYGPMAAEPAADGLVDVTSGDNTFRQGRTVVPGYAAARGYDVASGWGTVDASRFVPALARVTASSAAPGRAAAELAALQRALRVVPSSTGSPTATIVLSDSGFLPGHPVRIAIDGRPLSIVRADTSGNWSYSFTPARLALAPGTHTVSVHSMLLDQTALLLVGR